MKFVGTKELFDLWEIQIFVICKNSGFCVSWEINLHDCEPNLHFAGKRFWEERQKTTTFQSHKNDYFLSLNTSFVYIRILARWPHV